MTALLAQLVLLVDESPEPEDVKAGWTALVLFLLLIGAVVLLGFSLTKHLRRAQAAEEAGLYGSDEAAKAASDSDAESESHQAP
jgi:hypothetical protein